MNILVLAEDFYPNVSGGAHARTRFCEITVGKGHDVTVFTPRRNGTPKQETVNGIDIVRPFPAKPASVPAYATFAIVTRIFYSIALFGYLLWWLRSHDVDGIHSASHSMHWVGKLLGVIYGLPLVTFIGYTPSANESFRLHPQFLRERVNFHLFMGEKVYCRSEHVASIVRRTSGSDVSVLHGILHTERIHEADTDVDPKSVRQRFDISPDDTFAIFVGRLVPIKNPKGALDALAGLPEEYQLLVVGDGPRETDVQEYAELRDITDRVRFAGRLPHEETLTCIAASDLLLLPSKEEAYPTAVFEALALGSHVVATPVGVLPDIDHERLHLGLIEEFPSLIETLSGLPKGGIDVETLAKYSMERYTEQILEAFVMLLDTTDQQ